LFVLREGLLLDDEPLQGASGVFARSAGRVSLMIFAEKFQLSITNNNWNER
jgi:hypothetical protein